MKLAKTDRTGKPPKWTFAVDASKIKGPTIMPLDCGHHIFKTGDVENTFINLCVMRYFEDQALAQQIANEILSGKRKPFEIQRGCRKFVKTKVINLYRCESEDGKKVFSYFMRAKIRGKQVCKSLQTTSYEIAKVRLSEEYSNSRLLIERGAGASKAIQGGTFADIAAEYTRLDDESEEILDRTKIYHREIIAAIYKTWPGLAKKPIKSISRYDCDMWAGKFRKQYSPSRYNGAVDVMRGIFKVAVKCGLILNNPASEVEKASVKQKELTLPTHDQFLRMVKFLEAKNLNGGRRKMSGLVIKFLAYSGMRLNEAAQITPEMIDLEGEQFKLPKHIVKGQKKGRFVPIIAEMKPVLKKLFANYRANGGCGTLLPFRDPGKSLESACRAVGAPRITNHDLRHLFVTRCLESGVDIKTVAEWAGHVDGGALILKTYAHLRSEHSREMATKVSFT